MNSSGIEWCFAFVDAQETCALGKGCIAEPCDLSECIEARETSVFVALGDTVL